MIRVYKRHDAPEALEARGYNHDEVKRALLGKRNLMEERFWNLFVDDYVGFLGRLHAYIDNRNQDTYQLVVDDLYQDAPILGFKYNFIKHNTELFEIFKDEMKWNKPSHTH